MTIDRHASRKRPDGFEVYPDGYGPLFDRAAEVFARDERVRAMWLHGAFGRGAADAASDLDISLAVRDEDFDAFAAAWTKWLAEITPTVSAIPIAPGCFYALTPGCERFDIFSERVSELPRTNLRRRVSIFDRDDLTASIPAPDDPPPDPDTISTAVRETLRTAANIQTVLVREDWLLGVVAVGTIHSLLYQLFAEANKPQPVTGPKQYSFKLSPRHRTLLEQLPVPQPERQSVLDAREAALRLFLAEAPAVAAAADVPWPTDLADAVLGYLDRIGLGVPR
ncbi:hypothetical protein MLP_18680 [Microlunatus phosphovorus NM-1]|uniref:Polymerase beta nucleotidyltransferase domain-containing protein n=1 Tax=Microlunatus phosphovorus (strain ATCC 700054 / DSM 10555 / JCM 9379 / NBRC 101784 / NCIMB 13414 / VKM Ac-1990 / NM-1) TaxID=1032480 RepID=F5XT10_MICPN|nr:hypothetical protein [Microlunatus phosphovorus]BAK34882.1 hypothetical protein MLP_18680 [Microlunatus phosphovorus NM-1]